MRVALIGCVKMSAGILTAISTVTETTIVGVVTRSASPLNSDFCDLSTVANDIGAPVLSLEQHDAVKMCQWLIQQQPDLIFCAGWSYLLPKSLIDFPPMGVVGFHPAKLPQNRGRHPLIWTLALGLKETASTFFLMDEGADSGDIISQVPLIIPEAMKAGELYDLVSQTAQTQAIDIVQSAATGSLTYVAQDHSQANIWRKRSKLDGEIDWRMSAETIANLVRALGTPYPGAHCVQDAKDAKIWHATSVEKNVPANIEPGRVLEIREKSLLVKCGVGAVWLIEHELTIPKVGSVL